MEWKKRGLIYTEKNRCSWARTHAMIPTPELLTEEAMRVYVTVCDEKGIGRVSYVDVDTTNLDNVVSVAPKPILDIGMPGTFDENGVLVTSIVTTPSGNRHLYYVGFELGTKIRYRLLTGLAISQDGGMTFQRVKKTPILERSDQELYFRGGPFVMYENGIFRMWYVGGSKWMLLDGKEMPVYTINYLESQDGIVWGNYGKVCIDILHPNEHGFGRPYVIKQDGKYKMFYSIRVKHLGYRLGYAESSDGITWERKDGEIGLDVSLDGWDSEMICYSSVVNMKDKYYMLYNGNGFGKTGFGWAELMKW